MPEVTLLALPPGRFWLFVRVGAPIHDSRHPIAKFVAYLFQDRRPAAVFHYIMQESRNSLILVPASLQHQSRDAQDMRNIWNIAAFAHLPAVLLRGIHESILKSRPQL